MTNENQDPFTPLREAAVSSHELFVAYVDAGFTEAQAMQLLIGLMAASAGSIPPPPDFK